MFPFATEALAMSSGGGSGGASPFVQLIPFVVIFAIFYLLVIRPQQRKSKAHRELLSNLHKGDEVWTDSGILGTIQRIAEDSVTLEIAPKVAIRVQRARIAEVRKGTRLAEGKGGEGKAAAKDEAEDKSSDKTDQA
ncbi:MAG: preprotein translocase subunit YajC [Candidatus Lambdaproteobacteria bacterium]|nr:preprotein translocase subunit YajC [Candidatus Lambdaproteobacteria bacterium]